MEPTNDFTRPAPTRSARLARQLLTGSGAAIVLGAAAWTLFQLDPEPSTALRAASLFTMSETVVDEAPRYDGNALERPRGHERWIAVGASLGLGYGSGGGHEAFHQVFIVPSAYDAFVETGAFPEGTMLALDVAAVGQNVLPARTGRFADAREGLEFAVKDKRRPGGWAYYSFGDGTRATARAFPADACADCHRTHAQTDHVFTQFYPRLRALKRG